MYTAFYGFREKPFQITPDPGFLFLSEKHRLALSYLKYGIVDGLNFIVITGEIGSGKTTLIKKLLEQIGAPFTVATVYNTNVSSEQLIELILKDFNVDLQDRSRVYCLEALKQFLIKNNEQGKRSLLIIDEAQNLTLEALEEVRMISNLQIGKHSLIQVVMIAQPNFRDRMRLSSLAQLRQRISVSYHLKSLDSDETCDYIFHRIKFASYNHNGTIFTKEANEKIYKYSKGLPRTINMLCDAALLYGYADELKMIDAHVIENVVKDKKDLGLFSFDTITSDLKCIAEQTGNDLVRRIEYLENQMKSLSAMVEWQTQRYENQMDSYKDQQIQKLQKLLNEERYTNKNLLTENTILKAKIRAAHQKT